MQDMRKKGKRLNRILIVEDDRELMEGLCFSFREDGYEVMQAFSRQEAEAAVRELHFDLILLDWIKKVLRRSKMPGLLQGDGNVVDYNSLRIIRDGRNIQITSMEHRLLLNVQTVIKRGGHDA